MKFVLQQFVVVHIDKPGILDAYVDVDVYSQSVGRAMGKNDVWIAATASATKAELITTDHDFDHLFPTYLTVHWEDPTTT